MHKLSRAESYLPHHEPAPKGKPKPADPMAVLAPGMYPHDALLLTRSPVHSIARHIHLHPDAAPAAQQIDQVATPSLF